MGRLRTKETISAVYPCVRVTVGADSYMFGNMADEVHRLTSRLAVCRVMGAPHGDDAHFCQFSVLAPPACPWASAAMDLAWKAAASATAALPGSSGKTLSVLTGFPASASITA